MPKCWLDDPAEVTRRVEAAIVAAYNELYTARAATMPETAALLLARKAAVKMTNQAADTLNTIREEYWIDPKEHDEPALDVCGETRFYPVYGYGKRWTGAGDTDEDDA